MYYFRQITISSCKVTWKIIQKTTQANFTAAEKLARVLVSYLTEMVLWLSFDGVDDDFVIDLSVSYLTEMVLWHKR